MAATRILPLLLLVAAVGACGGSTSGGTVQSASARAAASPSPAATSSPAYENPFFKGAFEFAVTAAEHKTGISYVAAGCTSNPPCLSNGVETDGENATYIGFDAAGYSAGTKCYVYVYRDAVLGWQNFATLCGSKPDFSPVYGDTVPVRVSSGCANVRGGPGLSSPVVACLANGTQVRINATPSYADGKMWWGVQAADKPSGMMSQEFLQG